MAPCHLLVKRLPAFSDPFGIPVLPLSLADLPLDIVGLQLALDLLIDQLLGSSVHLFCLQASWHRHWQGRGH